MQLDGQFANERFTQETDVAERREPDYSRLRIKVSYDYPPIPIRDFDYYAVDDATYDGPGSPIGRGPNPQAAALDLITKISERDDADPLQILLEMIHGKENQC